MENTHTAYATGSRSSLASGEGVSWCTMTKDEAANVLLRTQRLLYNQTATLIRSLWALAKDDETLDIGRLTYDLFAAAQEEAGRLWEVWYRGYRVQATDTTPPFHQLPMEKQTEPRLGEGEGT